MMPVVTALFGAALLAAPQAPDTTSAWTEVKTRIREHYGWKLSTTNFRGGRLQGTWSCSPLGGQRCDGWDWHMGICPLGDPCHRTSEQEALVDFLLDGSRRYPQSGHVVGQTVTMLVRLGRYLEAMEVVGNCEATAWLCTALQGHVLRGVGRMAEVEQRFRRVVAEAPAAIACEFRSAAFVQDTFGVRPSYQAGSHPIPIPTDEEVCSHDPAVSDTIWWLADPLYVVEGNDRWAEHADRVLQARLFRELWAGGRDQYFSAAGFTLSWPDLIGRGPWDSYNLLREAGRPQRMLFWTSEEAARYHFVPDFEGQGLTRPTWNIDAGIEREGYTPPYGSFHEVAAQIARFRGDARADGRPFVKLAAAVSGDGPITGADSAYLVLSDGPGSFPLLLHSPFHEARAVFVAEAPAVGYVASIEIMDEAGIGRHREKLEPIEAEGPGISDLMFYEPHGHTPPDGVLSAASMMYAGLALQDVSELGLFWEVYGAEAGASIEFELHVERERGGVLQRLRRLLPGGSEESTGAVVWSVVAADGGSTPTAIALDGRGLGSGRLTFVLRARWNGQPDLETRRTVTVR